VPHRYLRSISTREHRGIHALAAVTATVALVAGALTIGPPDVAQAGKQKVTVSAPAPATVLRGEWAKTAVTITNNSAKKLKHATVEVAVAKGVTVKWKSGSSKKAKIHALKKGASTTMPVRIKLPNKVDKETAKIIVRVKGKKVATTKATITTGTKTDLQPKLTGRYFWYKDLYGFGYDDAVYFVTDTLAYHGTDYDGFPACTAVTVTEPGGDGCVTYTYDPATNAVAFDGTTAVLNEAEHVLEVDGEYYFEGVRQNAGTRYDADLYTLSVTGICPYCTSFTEDLRLFPDGRFLRSSAVSWENGGGYGTVLPPDSQGSYEVDGNSNLIFHYDDGTVRVDSVAVLYSDANVPDPVQGGMVIDGSGYFVSD
jgi:hypothetical protein